MEGTIGVITETWLAVRETLQQDISDLASGAGLSLICLNRDQNNFGVAHGGVAVAYRMSSCSMKRLEFPNPDNY